MGQMKRENFVNRDISWLYFNDRVLQEAENPNVPLVERMRFLGIFSNNLDEFFRVRVAANRRMITWRKAAIAELHMDPKTLLSNIQEIVIKQQAKFNKIYKKLVKEFESENIFMLDETKLSDKHLAFVRAYFRQKVRPSLVPIMLSNKRAFPQLKDKTVYLAVKLKIKKSKEKHIYSLIEVPSGDIPRIIELPKEENKRYIILLDDIIRVGLPSIFAAFEYDSIEAYTIKITRDAELDISEDISVSFLNKVRQSIANRKEGRATRFLYDENMPQDLLEYLMLRNNLEKGDNLIPGGRYHNFKDFIGFPDVGTAKLRYNNLPPLEHPDLRDQVSLLNVIQKKDVMLHFPFQAFHYLLDILREAAIKPSVTSIKMTLYRAAANSRVINALIVAAKNGKNVTVVIELQARFDEENNIQWARKLEEEGVRVIFGVPGLKVHSKLILIKEKVDKKNVLYAHVGTGNFHEGTARIYTDLSLFTCDKNITNEVQKVFTFFRDNYKRVTYRNLFVSPTNTRRNFVKLIDQEIKNAKAGKKAYILIKINNVVDADMIQKLYDASNAGVKIDMVVRGTCSVIPGVKGLSENITITSIVDRFLEHTRIIMFHNDGDEKYYLSSADWMTRNLDSRIEVTAPILDKKIQKELKDVLDFYLNDNVKARIIDVKGSNKFIPTEGRAIRSQIEVYKYYQKLLS